MVCEDVQVISSGFIDLPDVVVDGESSAVKINGSRRWRRIGNLPGVFVCIFSHESIHLVLGGVDQKTAEALDDVASLSAVSRSLNDVGLCTNYPHGLIGIDDLKRK